MINNMKFTRSGGTNQFVSANKVFFTDTDTHTFNAYYPYTANPTNDLIEFQCRRQLYRVSRRSMIFCLPVERHHTPIRALH